MSLPALNASTGIPAWMSLQQPGEAEKYRIAASYSDGDPGFSVSVAKLDELIQNGYVATPRYYYTVVGLPGTRIGFNAWCKKLGKDIHASLEDLVPASDRDELARLKGLIGNVSTWTEGFQTLFPYLRAAGRALGFSADDLVIVGKPSTILLAGPGTEGDEPDDASAAPGHDHRDSADVVEQLLNEDRNVIVEGVAGTGKSHMLSQLAAKFDRVHTVVFHPSTSYEEFVSGLRPQADGTFRGSAGTFVEACEAAAAAPDERHLLFIDEINRANTSRVFGDLMLPLEKSKRHPAKEATGHALTTERRPGATCVQLQTPVGPEARRFLVVPDNLFVLGTMNSSDRSVGTIDLALRRRFSWFAMNPLTADRLKADAEFALKIDAATPDEAQDWHAVVDWYDQTNEVLLTEIGPDARLGHAFLFAAETPEAAARNLTNQLAEVAFAFNIAPELLDNHPGIDLTEPRGTWFVRYQGKGLGRRPIVLQRIVDEEQLALPSES